MYMFVLHGQSQKHGQSETVIEWKPEVDEQKGEVATNDFRFEGRGTTSGLSSGAWKRTLGSEFCGVHSCTYVV